MLVALCCLSTPAMDNQPQPIIEQVKICFKMCRYFILWNNWFSFMSSQILKQIWTDLKFLWNGGVTLPILGRIRMPQIYIKNLEKDRKNHHHIVDPAGHPPCTNYAQCCLTSVIRFILWYCCKQLWNCTPEYCSTIGSIHKLNLHEQREFIHFVLEVNVLVNHIGGMGLNLTWCIIINLIFYHTVFGLKKLLE